MSSLKTLTSQVRELKNILEVADLLAPNDVKRLYEVVNKKAVERAVLDNDARLTEVPGRAAARVVREPCRVFAKGKCKRGG
eukprot:15483070-Alexandrium_andersonii.AAC.1